MGGREIKESLYPVAAGKSAFIIVLAVSVGTMQSAFGGRKKLC